MGKLLNPIESFEWTDKEIDRSDALNQYNDALEEARSSNDELFCSGRMYDPQNNDVIFMFMWLNGYQDYESLKHHFPWLKAKDFEILLTLSQRMGACTPNSSNDWSDFVIEYPNEHKSMIGLKDPQLAPLVYDIKTFFSFHSLNAASFNFAQQREEYSYFKKYYVPRLRSHQNIIDRQIRRGQVHRDIERLDIPNTDAIGNPIHGQQIHIHFNLGGVMCALNIDGTWKHGTQGNQQIPLQICETLVNWGFCLPAEYYE